MQKIMFNDRFCLTQAVLEGRKTMTRRTIKVPAMWHGIEVFGFSVNKDNYGNVTDITLVDADGGSIEDKNGSLGMIVPCYKIGEVVAIAQNYQVLFDKYGTMNIRELQNTPLNHKGWTNKMFVRADLMPHQIRITDIKVERLRDISDEDCLAEGIFNTRPTSAMFGWDSGMYYSTPREAFAALIDKISGKGTWESNPYVFVYEFELLK